MYTKISIIYYGKEPIKNFLFIVGIELKFMKKEIGIGVVIIIIIGIISIAVLDTNLDNTSEVPLGEGINEVPLGEGINEPKQFSVEISESIGFSGG